jgi:hypothetical protein
MKKFCFLMAVMGLIFMDIYSQQEISGKSKPKVFTINRDSQLKLPPNLVVKLQVTEPSGDSIIEGGEIATLKLTITNKGKGTAQGLKLRITDEIVDSSLSFEKEKEIGFLDPDKTLDIDIPVFTDLNLKTNKHILNIDVDESNGYSLDPSIQLIFFTLKYRRPKLIFNGYEVCDTCEGTSAIIADNALQLGELVKVKIIVQNVGENIARNVRYSVVSTDPNIKITNQTGVLGNMDIGENKSFTVFVSPNKKLKTIQLPVYLSLSLDKELGDLNSFPIPIAINQRPSEIKIVEFKPDMRKFEQQNATPDKADKVMPDEDNFKKIEQAPNSKTKRTNAVAVVIGIENYSYFAKAPYAENDARIIASYFKNTLGIPDVLVYTSEQARGYFFDNMLNLEYGELKSKVANGASDVFIFFSGHGIPSLTGEHIYLMQSDSKKDRLSNQGYSLTVFYENLQHLGARNVIVFLDACFSGVTRQSEKIQSENLLGMKSANASSTLKDPWINNPSFSIFNSSASDAISFAYDKSMTGLFTYFVCRGLQGEADLNFDKEITTGELEQYIQKEVMQTSRKIGGLQITQFHGNKDYVLVDF